jgi:hypothetical protein
MKYFVTAQTVFRSLGWCTIIAGVISVSIGFWFGHAEEMTAVPFILEGLYALSGGALLIVLADVARIAGNMSGAHLKPAA